MSNLKFFFNCNNSTQAKVLREVGAKNIFLNYKYVKNNISKLAAGFETVMVSYDNISPVQDYYDFAEELPDNYIILQADNKDPVMNLRFFKSGQEIINNLVPVFHGNYSANLALFKDEKFKTIALGNMKGIIQEDEALRRLPSQYNYHGLGKGRWVKNQNVSSVDSSTWLSGVRGRKTDVFGGQQITFGKKGLTNKSFVQAALTKNRVYAESLNLKSVDVIQGDYNSLMKVTHAVYYMPMFKALGIYDENYIS